MYFVCSQDVFCLFTGCILFVHRMYFVCTQDVFLFTGCVFLFTGCVFFVYRMDHSLKVV